MALAAAVEPLALLEADDLLRDEAAVPAVVRRLELCVPVRGRRLGLREDAVVGLGEDAVPVQRPRLGSRQVDVQLVVQSSVKSCSTLRIASPIDARAG